MTPSTPTRMTRTTTTHAICTSEHSSAPLVVLPVFLMMCHDPLGSSSLSLSSSRHVAHVSFSLSSSTSLFYFNLSFTVFFLSSVLMHPDLHTDLYNLDSVENNLRHSAKWSLDAYDVTHSLTCSQFPTEAMQWIKEVELVDSVDELRTSSSIRGISMPNFEVLDARIASALNKIIHNSHFKRRISLEEQKAQKQDSFLRGRLIAYLIYDYFRVTGIHDSVENYADLFTISLRNDIQEFDSKSDGILLSMTKIPPDDILEGLYKLRIRESDKLKTVLELYDLETHQKKLGPDYHRLKTMVKRSIEQEFEIRILGSGMVILRRTPWSRIREQNSVYKEFLEIVGDEKPMGSV